MQTKNEILLLGGKSFLGSSLGQRLTADGFALTALDRSQLDLASPALSGTIRSLLEENAYKYVVICAAVTDVNQCFHDPEGSHRTNVLGTKIVLDACRESGALPLFFSSDYVFGRTGRPAAEDAPRDPETIYGRQKAEIEAYIEKSFDRFVIFRTSKLMSRSPHPRNILWPLFESLAQGRKVRCFSDQWINGVFIEDVATAMKQVIRREARGIFHLGMSEILSRVEIAQKLAARFGFNPALIERIQLSDLDFPEPRANHNTLDCRRTCSNLGLRFTEFSDALPQLQWEPHP